MNYCLNSKGETIMENQNILTIKFNNTEDLALKIAEWNEILNQQCCGNCHDEKHPSEQVTKAMCETAPKAEPATKQEKQKTSEITVTDKNSILFKDMPEKFNVMRYHSLYVSEENLPEELTVTAKSDDGIIMALEHKTKDIYGIQFHPESFFTEYGKNIIKNFISNTKKETLQSNDKNTVEAERKKADEVFKKYLHISPQKTSLHQASEPLQVKVPK